MDQQIIQDNGEKVQDPMDELLEKCWFFDNLLLRGKRYSRCNSDLSVASSSSSIQEESSPSVSEVYARIIRRENSTEQETVEAVSHIKTNKLSHKNRPLMRPNQDLSRAPSLPANMTCEDVPKLSKLSRQSSLTPNPLPSRKGHARRPISRAESLNMEVINEMRDGYLKYQNNTRKTVKALEFEEVQGFKDLGFNFDTKNLSPDVVNILPGLQEKKNTTMSSIDEQVQVDIEDNDHHARKPYLSEAWQVQRSSSTISNWVVKKSSEDMKAQLKSWARTVASNVR